ncbi:ashwin isoform X1 [Ixodes scapularis]|uniref:ashwin isoform X1 n=1 Tax=Ixodes scapularis TaxID=6945 RepID=UPI0011618C42|nr:ashwin isoform X1 [Ixodes scapularis]
MAAVDPLSSSPSSGMEDADLLYPELMSTEALLSLFKKRHVSHPRLEELDKDSLVKLYRTTLLPLPQREYGQSRVGKRLAALQSSADSRHQKRKADSEDAVPSTRGSGKSHPQQSSRLKPPPSMQGSNDTKPSKKAKTPSMGEGDQAWGAWDKPKSKPSKKTSPRNHRPEAEGPPSKKQRNPITWP